MEFRQLALLLSVAALSGCNLVTAVFTSSVDKINAAFPLPDTAKVAYSALISSLDKQPPDVKATTDQYTKLMGVRALTCTAQASIGSLDTAASIKTKVTDLDCFKKQDQRLLDWIGLQRLSTILSRPPLVAMEPLPEKTLMPNFSEFSGQAAIAAEANVMVVKGTQRYTALQLPSGKTLNILELPDQVYRPASLSPNGQVLAVPVGSRNLRMIEVANGNLLWSTDDYSDVIAWFPQVQGALLAQANTGAPQLLDIANGRVDAFPATEKRLSWALPTKAADGKFLVGSAQTVSQMDVVRNKQGQLEAAPVQQWRIAGNGISSNQVFLMGDGTQLVYQTGQDLGWLNLATQQQGTWQLSALNAYGFAKLSERTILFDSRAAGDIGTTTRVLDTVSGTVAVAKNTGVRDGNTISLLPRTGYLRRSDSVVTLGTNVHLDEPQPLGTLVSDALLAKELAKLNASTNNASPDTNVAPNPYHEALARQVRAQNTASAIRDGLPRDVIESIRRGSATAGQGQAAAVQPLLSDVPSNARVTAIGVYEGSSGVPRAPGAGGGNRLGSVRVNVLPGSTPLVLVLSSYEPVNWIINSSGRKISKILVSGYYDSNVIGADRTPVIKIGNKYAYKLDSNEYAALKQEVARYVSNPIQLFQGSYMGKDFSIN